jgi:superfamily II DNA or RNA helicase
MTSLIYSTLFPHQKECVNAIRKYEDKHSRMLLHMTPGSGKTRIFFHEIVHTLHLKSKSRGYKCCVIIFPRIQLITQFNRDYLENDNWKPQLKNVTHISVCSEDERDDPKLSINFTTKLEEIENFLKTPKTHHIITVTYQSFLNVFKTLQKFKIDLMVFDEAHHTTSTNMEAIVYNPKIKLAKQILFVTATPENTKTVTMLPDQYLEGNQELENFMDDENESGEDTTTSSADDILVNNNNNNDIIIEELPNKNDDDYDNDNIDDDVYDYDNEDDVDDSEDEDEDEDGVDDDEDEDDGDSDSDDEDGDSEYDEDCDSDTYNKDDNEDGDGEDEDGEDDENSVNDTDNDDYDDDYYSDDGSYLECGDCGPVIFTFSHMDAVEAGICTDFDLTCSISLSSDEGNKESECPYYEKYKTIIRSAFNTGNGRILTFHSLAEKDNPKSSNVKDFTKYQDEFKRAFNEVAKNEFKNKKTFTKASLQGIVSDTKNKQTILEKHNKTPSNQISILASCETIGEGTDTTNTNCVLFNDPKGSIRSCIQGIGRLTRRGPLKSGDNGTVLLPVVLDKMIYDEHTTTKERDEYIQKAVTSEGQGFETILKVIAALKQSDPYYYNLCLKYPFAFSPLEIKKNLNKQGYKIIQSKGDLVDNVLYCKKKPYEPVDKSEINQENVQEVANKLKTDIEIHTTNMETPIVKFISEGEEENKEMVRIYKDEKTGVFHPIISNGKIKEGEIRAPLKRKKPFKFQNNAVLAMNWDIEKIFDINQSLSQAIIRCNVTGNEEKRIEEWMKKLEELKTFMDEHQARPTPKTNQRLCSWISTQFKNSKEPRKEIMRNNIVFFKWYDFLNNKKYDQYFLNNEIKWNSMLEKLTEYIRVFKKKPTKKTNKLLCCWVESQVFNFKHRKKIMTNVSIVNKWKAFINDEEFYNLFHINKDDEWNDTLEEFVKFLDNNNRRPLPKDDKHLHSWMSHQINYVKINKNITDVRMQKWNDVIQNEKYKHLFNFDFIDNWKTYFQKLLIFINTYNKKPTYTDNKILSQWTSTQIQNFKKNKKCMKNSEIFNMWNNMITDEKYKKYFIDDTLQEWNINFEELLTFIDTYKILPTLKINKKLSYWTQKQNKDYKNHTNRMKNPECFKKWTNMINDVKYSRYFLSNVQEWYNKFSDLIQFIENNNKRPSEKTNSKLNSWTQNQVKNFKEPRKNIMKSNIEVYNSWNSFVNDNKYAHLFTKDNQKEWQSKFDELIIFMDNNLKRPTPKTNYKLCRWVDHQLHNVTYKIKIMSNKHIRDIWTNMVSSDKYSKYFIKSNNNIPNSNEETISKNFNPSLQFTQLTDSFQSNTQTILYDTLLPTPTPPSAPTPTSVPTSPSTPTPAVKPKRQSKKPSSAKKCNPHVFVLSQNNDLPFEDEYFYYKVCSKCNRKKKDPKIVESKVSGSYHASNPEKKLEINTWLASLRYAPNSKAILLDADGMLTTTALVSSGCFQPSNIIIPEYDDDTFETNSKHPHYGMCLRNGRFLEDVLMSHSLADFSLIYADFTGHFKKFVEPLLDYLLTHPGQIQPHTILGLTWCNNGAMSDKDVAYNQRKIGNFEIQGGWKYMDDSPSGKYGGIMEVCFLIKV